MKEIEIPEGYEAKIEDNKVIFEKKESEDERIRKEIIDWMKGGNTYDWLENKEKWIAYLEKQKEQKPADVSEKIEELCSKYPLNKDVMSEQELSAYHQGLTFGATKIAEYLGEQKPAEWSEEDEYVINKVLNWAEIVNPTSTIFEKLPKEQFIERLKSLRPQPHWKPSEEQMDTLETAVSSLQSSALESLYNKLKKL